MGERDQGRRVDIKLSQSRSCIKRRGNIYRICGPHHSLSPRRHRTPRRTRVQRGPYELPSLSRLLPGSRCSRASERKVGCCPTPSGPQRPAQEQRAAKVRVVGSSKHAHVWVRSVPRYRTAPATLMNAGLMSSSSSKKLSMMKCSRSNPPAMPSPVTQRDTATRDCHMHQ